MTTNFEQTPDDVRGRAGRHHGVVPGLRDHAEGDPGWADELYERAGFGAHAFIVAARDRLEARNKGWTSIADGHQGMGDVGNYGAITFEHADADGKAKAKQVSGEA
ncbi:hypothetical protein [Nocardia sp. NPDC002869]|uniref:hypothetical protein n=1 Tax=Nocardia sp. NPDC002869 TaxID=3161032 RepID=UPI00398CCF32